LFDELLVAVSYGDVEVEADERVGGPADAVHEGSQRQEQGHVLDTLRLDHHFLIHASYIQVTKEIITASVWVYNKYISDKIRFAKEDL